MSTIVFKSAVNLLGGHDLSGDEMFVQLEMESESLDRTTFGADTRIHAGGMQTVRFVGRGFWNTAGGVDSKLFAGVGNTDEVFSLFPDGVVEGSTDEGGGLAMQAFLAGYRINGEVGQLLDMEFDAIGVQTGRPHAWAQDNLFQRNMIQF